MKHTVKLGRVQYTRIKEGTKTFIVEEAYSTCDYQRYDELVLKEIDDDGKFTNNPSLHYFIGDMENIAGSHFTVLSLLEEVE